jgi:primosomal protein N'
MQYSIKELNQHWISKNLIYEALKNSLPFSNEFLKNKRIFNELDLEIFLFYKDYGVNKTVSRYWTSLKINNNESIWKQFQTVPKQIDKQFQNSNEEITKLIKKSITEEIKTVKKQFEDRELELLNTIKQKDEIIDIKNNQTQKYALLKVEQEKEKKEWIKKYEEENKKKGEWMKKFYWIRTYLFIFIVLFCLLTIFFILFFMDVIKL